METIKKYFVIASSEYKANMPDLFLMDAEGRYYGVSENSYARWDDFPNSVEHWQNRVGSDADRHFHIDEVELPTEQVEKFDALTRDYKELNKKIADTEFPEKAPKSSDFLTHRSFMIASNKWLKRLHKWWEEHDTKNLVAQEMELWMERTRLFTTFSKKVTEAISYHDDIKRANHQPLQ